MGNQIKVGSIVTPSRGNMGISAGCIAYIGCRQAPTDPTCAEMSGAGIFVAPGAALVPATAFASPQGIATAEAASTDITVRIGLADYTYSYNAEDSLLISTRVKLVALPAATKPLWAQGGNNTAAQGLSLNVQNTGAILFRIDHPSGQQFSANTDQAGPAGDGKLDTNWRTVTFGWWAHILGSGSNGSCNYSVWIDGEPAYSGGVGYRQASSLVNSITPQESFRIGAYYRASGPTVAAIGGLHSNVHVYRAPKAVTNTYAKLEALARRLHLAPHIPLSLAEWPMV